MRDYILEISFDAADAALDELLQSRLFLTASTGSSSVDVAGTATISAYFDSAADRDEALATLRDLDGVELHPTERERQDWLARYEQSLAPLVIGASFLVVPDARLIPPGTSRHVLIVPQEQAFGTGSHETTSLCIEMLETMDVAGKRGLDVGAGSGILALAMCRLGAARVVAFDNDVDAYGALRDNRMRNDVDAAQLAVFIGGFESLRGGCFGVITMNILPEVIVPLLGEVVARLDGTLILSGILTVRSAEVIEACAAHQLTLVEWREKGEWWAGLFRRSTSR